MGTLFHGAAYIDSGEIVVFTSRPSPEAQRAATKAMHAAADAIGGAIPQGGLHLDCVRFRLAPCAEITDAVLAAGVDAANSAFRSAGVRLVSHD